MLQGTPVCDFGWQAPSFDLSDANGTPYRFNDLMGRNGLLIAFICNHCPYVHAIIDRLVADAETLRESGINVAAIMSNDYANYPDDSPARMLEFAAKHQMNFPYLVDETQDVARAYNAICTPDFFGLDTTGGLQYRGRLDDARMADAKTSDIGERVPELVNAMHLMIKNGRGPEDQIPSMGCSIKFR